MPATSEPHRAGTVVELRLPARLDRVHLARCLVVSVAQTSAAPFDDRRLDDLRLVVSEACTNAVEAQALVDRDGTPGVGRNHRADSILVRCTLLEDGVAIEVVDQGPGLPGPVMAWFEASPIVPPASGFGLYLMRTLADSCEIRSTPVGTTARLCFLGAA